MPGTHKLSGDLVKAIAKSLRNAFRGSGIGGHSSNRARVANQSEEPLPIAPQRQIGGERYLIVREVVDSRKDLLIVRKVVNSRRSDLESALLAETHALQPADIVHARERVAQIESELTHEAASKLKSALHTTATRTDYWFDPYVGFAARYNFNPQFYLASRGDIGGFALGSEITWQAEVAYGCQLTRHLFTEVGYRALGVDYENNGLTFNIVGHGAQITVGVAF